MTLYRGYFVTGIMWLCITIFYCYQYILRLIPNLIMPELFAQFNIGAKEFGTFAGIYYIGYIVIHIPIGLLLDRFGAKLVLPLCIILTTLGLTPILYATSWEYVLVGRLFTGIGSSAAIVGALQIFRIIFPNNFSRMLGIMVCFSLITVVYSNKPLSQILHLIGMREVIGILTIIGIVLAVLMYFLLPRPIGSKYKIGVLTEIKSILYNYKLLLASILAGLMVGPLEGFADAWSNAFIHTVYGVSAEAASAISASILTGMCIGCIILPYVADKYNMHYAVTIISGIGMMSGLGCLLLGSANELTLNIACLVLGFFCAYQVVIISKIATYMPDLSGATAAVANMIIMAFGSIFHSLIGFTMDKLWDGKIQDGIKIYTSDAYIKGISVLPIAIIISIIGFIVILIKDKKTQGN